MRSSSEIGMRSNTCIMSSLVTANTAPLEGTASVRIHSDKSLSSGPKPARLLNSHSSCMHCQPRSAMSSKVRLAPSVRLYAARISSMVGCWNWQQRLESHSALMS